MSWSLIIGGVILGLMSLFIRDEDAAALAAVIGGLLILAAVLFT